MIDLKKSVFAAAVAVLATSFAAPSPAVAQTTEYAVKYVCGTAQHSFGSAAGEYFTLINIHNPLGPLQFRWKVALSQINTGGPISGFNTAALLSDQAMEIDCRVIANRLSASSITFGPFHTGFVVIQTQGRDLDVVAVYSAQPTGGQVSTLHTERVPPRRP